MTTSALIGLVMGHYTVWQLISQTDDFFYCEKFVNRRKGLGNAQLALN
jgi:hypothetical protein